MVALFLSHVIDSHVRICVVMQIAATTVTHTNIVKRRD